MKLGEVKQTNYYSAVDNKLIPWAEIRQLLISRTKYRSGSIEQYRQCSSPPATRKCSLQVHAALAHTPRGICQSGSYGCFIFSTCNALLSQFLLKKKVHYAAQMLQQAIVKTERHQMEFILEAKVIQNSCQLAVHDADRIKVFLLSSLD